MSILVYTGVYITSFATKDEVEFRQNGKARVRLQRFHECFEIKMEQNMKQNACNEIQRFYLFVDKVDGNLTANGSSARKPKNSKGKALQNQQTIFGTNTLFSVY